MFILKEVFFRVLHEFGLLACRPVMNPLLENVVLAHNESKFDKYLENITSYQKLFGKLIYLTITWPNISFSSLFESKYACSSAV